LPSALEERVGIVRQGPLDKKGGAIVRLVDVDAVQGSAPAGVALSAGVPVSRAAAYFVVKDKHSRSPGHFVEKVDSVGKVL
jgi:hypothetical protein